ncbi:hypothetical protein [Salinimicrobium oceani]|uniref:Secreted protein n=1 Tax=Salinimicrobium oceani TaxID=2722702 RepID=A0ABX1D2X0_9FLAO|nr:hypothetical protein [Salinimicrobium oceani]NJW54014.1 hypothetical protein [Salinimicrobium oceani]
MKISAVLIALLVLVLNGIPCCADDCGGEVTSQEQEKESHSNELCSPFLSCGTCNAVVFQEEVSKMSFLEPVISTKPTAIEMKMISEFTYRIWQPPKNS